jgi:hypothetical protein
VLQENQIVLQENKTVLLEAKLCCIMLFDQQIYDPQHCMQPEVVR